MKRMKSWLAIGLMMVTSIMTGCGIGDEPVLPSEEPNVGTEPQQNEGNERADIPLTPSEELLVIGGNEFAFNLFRKVAEEPKSAIISPISITFALGMLNNGAAGKTQAEINKVLGYGYTGADGINDFCRKMLTEAPSLDKLTKLLIAKTIYVDKGYELKPAFKEKAKTYYDAEPETLDFHDAKTMDVINQWASDHTEKMITDVLDEDSFNPDFVSYLLNATYFKGAWAKKFDKGNTREDTFWGTVGVKKVPMMHQEQQFEYTDDDICQVLRMPYGNGAYSMTILLPLEGKTIKDVLKSMTAKKWNNLKDMETALADVMMPRFELSSHLGLNEIMSELGMPTAFDEGNADFSSFCDLPTYIGLMKQVARIKVNEEGTEAVAVPVIGMGYKDSLSQEPKRIIFHANRPFLYVISEKSTDAIFFIGQFIGD